MIICIGPFCIPVIWGLPFFAALFMSLKTWLTNLIFGVKKENVLMPEPSQPPTVTYVKDAKEFEGLLGSNERVILDFTATWCGPCQKIAPFFAELSSRFTNTAFAKIDVDELAEVAEAYKVSAMPTFVTLRNGKEIGRVIGADRAELEEAIATLSL